MSLMLWVLFVSIGFNLLLFIPAYKYKTDKLTDLSYSITFILLAIIGYSHSQMSPVHTVLLIMVLLWAVRLGGFLFIRIKKIKKDSRFDQMRNNFSKFGRFWFFQGLSVFLVLSAALSQWDTPVNNLGLLAYAGWLIFGFGLTIEAVADYQKYLFNNIKQQDVWIDIGLWRISRHPNYLGEIMVWLGIYVFCFTSLTPPGKLFGLISPLYITTILLFFSGIPLVEKAADKKWGKDEGYQNYKKTVPVLLPSAKSLNR